MTLVELLMAALLLSVSLAGMVGTWLYMIQGSITVDNRAAAYECARMVMERARSNGFSVNQPDTMSLPMGNTQSTWQSGHYVPVRYFDAELQELAAPLPPAVTVSNTLAPDGARFEAHTSLSPASNFPADRPDLRMVGIVVTVYLIDAQRNTDRSTPIAELKTSISVGGV